MTAQNSRLENRVTFLTHRINSRLQQVSLPVIAPYGLDLYSSRILFALAQNGSMKVGELVELMALPQSTISHQVKRMEKAGLVHRIRSDLDNRSVEVTVSDQGREATRVCTALSDAILERLNEALTEDEMGALVSGLGKVFQALDDIQDLDERCSRFMNK